jgi:hypothetical protein
VTRAVETGIAIKSVVGNKHEQWPGLSPIVWLLIVVVLALPIFAHGCHAGDHDDEPALFPLKQDAESPG